MTDQPATPNPSPSRGYAQPQSSTYTEFEQEKTTDNNASLKPFPGLAPQPSFQYSASLHPLDTTFNVHPTIASPHAPTPQSAGLRLQTDQLAERKREESTSSVNNIPTEDLEQTHFNAGLPVRTSSIRSVYGRRHRADSLSPSSALSSPAVGPLADMTPLPSPISAWGSPGFSRRSIDSEASDITPIAEQDPDIPIEPIEFASTSPKKRKIPLVARDIIGRETQIYNASAFSKNRSVSEYVPEGVQIPRSRNIVVSTSGASPIASGLSPPDNHMQREQYLAIQRGLAIPIPKPPTPPDSNRGADSGELESPRMTPEIAKGPVPLLYEAYKVHGGNLRRWRALRQLGKGTFSNVMLATSEGVNGLRDPDSLQHNEDGIDRKSLVAVKICEQGPAGGVDERKIEVSIKRELEIMKSINHPSLVQLKAVNICERQAFLVLNYCPGGDLFELASLKLDLVTPSLIQRIFSELVAAVRYLHLQYIVHRDIKLESETL